MTLRIEGESTANFPQYGWGVVRERLGDAASEALTFVFPLEYKTGARDVANTFDTERTGGFSWLCTSVSLTREVTDEDGRKVGIYVEASNLTHPG